MCCGLFVGRYVVRSGRGPYLCCMSNRKPMTPDARARIQEYMQEVERRAAGQWSFVLEHVGSTTLREHVQKASSRRSNPRHGPCPVHGGSDGFRLFKNWEETGGGICNSCGAKAGGVSLLAWDRSWGQWVASKEIGQVLGFPAKEYLAGLEAPDDAPPPPDPQLEARRLQAARDRYRQDVRNEQALERCLKRIRKIDWTQYKDPVVRYFEYRGLGAIRDDPPSDLYALPVEEYGYYSKHEKRYIKYGALPSFVALQRGQDDKVVSMHRIWVTPDGEKPFLEIPEEQRPPHKMGLGMPDNRTMNGSAVRLYDADHTLGIGEGLETMLGVRLLMAKRRHGRRLAVWSTLTAGGLERTWIPDHVSQLLEFVDNDEVHPRSRSGLGRGLEAGLSLRKMMIAKAVLLLRNIVTALQCDPEARCEY